MSKQETYETQFVDRMPPDDMLKDGMLYVAPHFHVAVHKCMCGCGEKVVTPWKTADGHGVTTVPSRQCPSIHQLAIFNSHAGLTTFSIMAGYVGCKQ